MNEQWQELKETITEMRDNDGTGTQQEACKFLANLMDVLEKQMSGSEIPNSSDCISRQAAIDALYHVDEYNGRSIEAIRDLPPVTPQPKTGHWIPVSERLPEEMGEYLITIKARPYLEISWFYPSNKEWSYRNADIIAWMPLPKPYEPQESNDKCKNCEYYRNPDYTRCHECKAESEE